MEQTEKFEELQAEKSEKSNKQELAEAKNNQAPIIFGK